MYRHYVNTFAFVAILATAGMAHADTMLDRNAIVTTASGKPVVSVEAGSCVRTKEVVGQDVCAPSVRTTTTRTVLTDDERRVYFEFNKADLTPAARRNLDDLARRLSKAQDVASASISGFADRIGASDYNVQLSARRAAAVRDYLVKNGYLNVNVVDARAYGDTRPVTSCPTTAPRNSQIACLSPDRRVDIELTYVDRYQVSSTR